MLPAARSCTARARWHRGARLLVLFTAAAFAGCQGVALATTTGGPVDGDATAFSASSMIERVETITGGASAVYGADAVGGVTNFILRKDHFTHRLDTTTFEEHMFSAA